MCKLQTIWISYNNFEDQNWKYAAVFHRQFNRELEIKLQLWKSSHGSKRIMAERRDTCNDKSHVIFDISRKISMMMKQYFKILIRIYHLIGHIFRYILWSTLVYRIIVSPAEVQLTSRLQAI